MDFTQSLSPPHASRVVVLGIGDVPRPKMREYLAALRESSSEIPLSSLNFTKADREKCPLEFFDTSLGHLAFHFMSEREHASRDGTFDCLRATTIVQGLICIAHCPSSPDLSHVYDEFLRLQRRFPTARVNRCFAFEPLESQEDLLERKNLVMFPNCDSSQLRFYLRTNMEDFGSMLLRSYHRSIREQDFGNLTCPELDKTAEMVMVAGLNSHKLNKSRVKKITGDYSVLCCSPFDAMQYYEHARSMSQDISDFAWSAVAEEGVLIARILQGAVSGTSKFLEEAIDMLESILSTLAKVDSVASDCIQISTQVKFAKYCAHFGEKELALSLLSKTAIPRRLGLEYVISFTVECALVCHSIGFSRKYAMFLKNAANLYTKPEQIPAQIALLLLAAKAYGLRAFDDSTGDDESLRRSPVAKRWATVQMKVLDEIIFAASSTNIAQHGDLLIKCYSHKIRMFHPWLSSSRQQRIHDRLKLLTDDIPPTRPLSRTLSFEGLPQLDGIMLVRSPDFAKPIPRTSVLSTDDHKSSRESVFIFQPQKSSCGASGNDEVIVIGEIVDFRVYLSNPMTFDVEVQDICLSTTGADFECSHTSVVLPARTTSHMLTLSGKVVSAGSLSVRGCFIRCFNLLTEHRCDSFGRGLRCIPRASLSLNLTPPPLLEHADHMVPSAARQGERGDEWLSKVDTPPASHRSMQRYRDLARKGLSRLSHGSTPSGLGKTSRSHSKLGEFQNFDFSRRLSTSHLPNENFAGSLTSPLQTMSKDISATLHEPPPHEHHRVFSLHKASSSPPSLLGQTTQLFKAYGDKLRRSPSKALPSANPVRARRLDRKLSAADITPSSASPRPGGDSPASPTGSDSGATKISRTFSFDDPTVGGSERLPALSQEPTMTDAAITDVAKFLTARQADISKVRVISPLPRATIISHSFHSCRDSQAHAEMLIGESRSLEIVLQNVGSLPIGGIHIDIEERRLSPPRGSEMVSHSHLSKMFSPDSDEPRHSNLLPIQPGAKHTLSLPVIARPFCRGAAIRIFFSDEPNSEFVRFLETEVRVRVQVGLAIRSLHLYPPPSCAHRKRRPQTSTTWPEHSRSFSKPATARRASNFTDRLRQEQKAHTGRFSSRAQSINTLGSTYRDGSGEDGDAPHGEKRLSSVDEQRAKGAGALGGRDDGFSLDFLSEMGADERDDFCVMALDLENTSNLDFALFADVFGEDAVAPSAFVERHSRHFALFPLRRFSFGEDDDACLRRFAGTEATCDGEDITQVLERCRRKLLRKLSFRWVSRRSGESGSVSLAHLKPSVSTLAAALVELVKFNVRLEGSEDPHVTSERPATTSLSAADRTGSASSPSSLRRKGRPLRPPASSPPSVVSPSYTPPAPALLSSHSMSSDAQLAHFRSSAGTSHGDGGGGGLQAHASLTPRESQRVPRRPWRVNRHSSDSLQCPLRVFRKLHVKVTNTHASKSLRMRLVLEHLSNGSASESVPQDNSSAPTLVWQGSLNATISELSPGSSYSHAFSVMFLRLGTFEFDVFCETLRDADDTTPGEDSSIRGTFRCPSRVRIEVFS